MLLLLRLCVSMFLPCFVIRIIATLDSAFGQSEEADKLKDSKKRFGILGFQSLSDGTCPSGEWGIPKSHCASSVSPIKQVNPGLR